MVNIVLCGGSGTRLWPISRKMLPKQFIQMFDKKSLFQKTLERNRALSDEIMIVANEEQYFLAFDQMQEIDSLSDRYARYLLEPFGRNTAPAIALACMALNDEVTVLVTPSDHLINKTEEYHRSVEKAKELARKGHLVTFGIKPESAETGYGYIHANGDDVEAFVEKPNKEKAKEYLKSGNYYWNSGMFCFRASVYLAELKKYAPAIFEKCQEAFQKSTDRNLVRIHPDKMSDIPEDSIDYAVMEKSDLVKIVPVDIGWSDLGSFDSLRNELPVDEFGNTATTGYIQVDSKNNMVITSERMIATVGVENLNIIDTPDALLIAKTGTGQEVKKIVQKLIDSGSELSDIHQTVHRPWGTYTVLEEYEKYKIKRISVKPGCRLSLQKHFHRNEHWVIVSGTAIVRVNDKETTLQTNQSVYIPMGQLHRLENPGKVELVLIEVQVGDYLGEDDIVRVEDDYKRD